MTNMKITTIKSAADKWTDILTLTYTGIIMAYNLDWLQYGNIELNSNIQ